MTARNIGQRFLAGMKIAIGLVPLALLLVLPPSLVAQERIRAYDTDIEIRADGSIDVTERITVRAEGSQIRRGIYRDIPTRYRDRFGNRVVIDLDVLGVERDGAPEAWFTERQRNGIRINTGGDDYLPALPREYTFTLRYRATRQLGFFAGHDELYWNAIGTGWVFPIESGTVTVRLPEPVPVDLLSAEAYTGPQGAQGTAYAATLPAPGTANYRLTQPLRPYDGFTIVLTFPKGLFAEPTRAQRVRWLLRDNAGVLIVLGGLIVLLFYTSVTWWRVGRDPRRGVIIPRYEPPAVLSPAALRFLRRTRYDMRCFSSDLLALAVAGHVRIHQDRKWLSTRWSLERTEPREHGPGKGTVQVAANRTADAVAGVNEKGAAESMVTASIVPSPHPTQRLLLAGLFPAAKRRIELHKKNAVTLSGARTAHNKALEDAVVPRYLERHSRKVWLAFAIILVSGFAAFRVSGGAGTLAIVIVLASMMMVLAIFGWLVRAPTQEGRRLLDEIEGLKLYLSVAERDRLARLQAPDNAPKLDVGHYEALLPYAVALDVEEAWTRKFTAAAGAAAVAAATQSMGWYTGSGRPSDLGGFTRAIGSSLSSTIASSSTPPGSSSGSGGGGSSGGGGGGGGGGGR